MPNGPSSSAAPYILGSEPNIRFVSIATVGDVIGANNYRMVGIPDGLGAWDNGDNETFTVVMNHELGSTSGIVRDHGAKGAFVSQLVIDKGNLAVLSADDAIKSVMLWNDATESFVSSTYAIGRLCSADLAEQSAYLWTDPNSGITYGTTDKIFMTGEENGSEGKEFGLVLTGAEAGTAYELAYTGLYSWENALSNPFAQRQTINIGTDDSGGGQLYVYVGEKQDTGNAVERAGLMYGDLYGIKVDNFPLEDAASAVAASGRFTLQQMGNDGDVSKQTGAQLEAESVAEGVTGWARPEDGHWDPTNPNVFYFVTTASVTTNSRLYKLTFDDITNPLAGGTVEALLDGTEGHRMLDNMTVDANGVIWMQEDVGGNARLGKIWRYDPVTDTLVEVAAHDAALYTAGSPTFKTIDEESSGIIDVTDIIGDEDTQAFLLDVQSHNSLPDPELVQDGQLLAMFVDTPELIGDKFANDLFGSEAAETFNGAGGNDTIRAGSGVDYVKAGAGDDVVDGGAGADYLRGQAGNDTLFGGLGGDRLRGDAGNDTYVYASTADSSQAAGSVDRIDMVSGEDKIDLSAIDANSTVAGNGSFAFVGTAFTGAAGEVGYYTSGSGQLYVAAEVDGVAGFDMLIAVNGATSLTATDFVL